MYSTRNDVPCRKESTVVSSDADPQILYHLFEGAPDAMLLVDGLGSIVKINRQTERIFGYERDELIGQAIEVLVPSRYAHRHAEHRSNYTGAPRARAMGSGLDLIGRRKDGTELPLDIMLSPLDTKERLLVLAVARDITERRRIEAAAVQAWDTYLKEMHHRVKNNLQVISSLLFLQSTHSEDARIAEMLTDSQNRIKSIALVHEKLYRSHEMSRLNFSEYVRDLVADLFRTYGTSRGNLRVVSEVDGVSLGIETAIPCGLIINELVSNVLKHAFPAGMGGEIAIRLNATAAGAFVLEVRDNGVGLPADFDWQTSHSLGLKLVHDLARQWKASSRFFPTRARDFRSISRNCSIKNGVESPWTVPRCLWLKTRLSSRASWRRGCTAWATKCLGSPRPEKRPSKWPS